MPDIAEIAQSPVAELKDSLSFIITFIHTPLERAQIKIRKRRGQSYDIFNGV
jgi:hypothetical protein